MKQPKSRLYDSGVLLTLGNSVSWESLLMFVVAGIISTCQKVLYLFMELVDICLV